ncbi:unnamed protein product, partial [Ectocarpus sp. 8 AP-2014]
SPAPDAPIGGRIPCSNHLSGLVQRQRCSESESLTCRDGCNSPSGWCYSFLASPTSSVGREEQQRAKRQHKIPSPAPMKEYPKEDSDSAVGTLPAHYGHAGTAVSEYKRPVDFSSSCILELHHKPGTRVGTTTTYWHRQVQTWWREEGRRFWSDAEYDNTPGSLGVGVQPVWQCNAGLQQRERKAGGERLGAERRDSLLRGIGARDER